MSYFKWTGVDIAGKVKKGKSAAYSPQDLSKLLLQRGISLIKHKSLYSPTFLWPITQKTKGELLAQIAELLRAGVLLPNAFIIVAQQSHNPIIHDIFFTVAREIEQGMALSKSFEKHRCMADPIAMLMLAAGHESGNIIHALGCAANYFEKTHAFNKNVRAILAMPFLTFLFFIGISLFIFIAIVPRFADMLHSMNQELPPLTKSIIAISDFIGSFSMVWVSAAMIMVGFFLYRYCCTASGKKKLDYALSYLPFIGTIMWQQSMSQALQAVSLLVVSGIPLVDALKMVSEVIDDQQVKSHIALLHDDVASGQSLSKAMTEVSVFLPEVVALIHVGEESGTMGCSLENAAIAYAHKVDESLRRFVFFLQPIVIIMLGLLITLLICAVYAPIMQFSYGV